MVTSGAMKKIFVCSLLMAQVYNVSFAMPANEVISRRNHKRSPHIPKLNPKIVKRAEDSDQVKDVIRSAGRDTQTEKHASKRQLPVSTFDQVPRRIGAANSRKNFQTVPVRAERPPIRPSTRRRFGSRRNSFPTRRGGLVTNPSTSNQNEPSTSGSQDTLLQGIIPGGGKPPVQSTTSRIGTRNPLPRRPEGRMVSPSFMTENQKTTAKNDTNVQMSKFPEKSTPKSINISQNLDPSGMADMSILNESAHVMNSAPRREENISPPFQEESIPGKTSTKSSLILGGAISGCAICFFLIVMLVVMWMQRSTKSRSQGSIREIKAKEQAQRKRRVPRMKSMREVRDTIFTSFRKVRRPRR